MGKAVQQTQRETHEAAKKPGSRACAGRKENLPTALEIGIFPISFSGRRPIVLPRPFRQSSLVKMTSPVRLDPAERLILLRGPDRFRKWQSLDDRRFCRCCHKFISGRQIEVIEGTKDEDFHLACPTTDCSSRMEDWVYPDEIAQPRDRRRRVVRVVDKDGERFIVCVKSQAYSRRRLSQQVVFGSRTAA